MITAGDSVRMTSGTPLPMAATMIQFTQRNSASERGVWSTNYSSLTLIHDSPTPDPALLSTSASEPVSDALSCCSGSDSVACS